MTNIARKVLQDGFEELDACIQRIGAKTGLNSAQIVERWDATKTRVVNSWNIYQSFFEERRDQELARLDPEVHTHREQCPPFCAIFDVNFDLVGAIPNKATISACYDLFKLSKPDTYDSILRSWYRLRLMTDGSDMSMSKCARDFKKHAEKIDALVGAISSLLLLFS